MPTVVGLQKFKEFCKRIAVTSNKPVHKRRLFELFSMPWQGRFKRALPAADVLTGQRFERGVRNLPARWLVKLC